MSIAQNRLYRDNVLDVLVAYSSYEDPAPQIEGTIEKRSALILGSKDHLTNGNKLFKNFMDCKSERIKRSDTDEKIGVG